MTNIIKLNFIDRSNDPNNSDIVFYQKNVATDYNSLSVAWKVIQHCGQGCNHPFQYPLETEVSASDSWGNYTPRLKASNGQLFHVTLTPSGNELSLKGPGTSTKEIQVQNDLVRGAINACVYKDGRLIATKTAVAPAQKAVFQFKPTLFAGVASQIVEGDVMDSAVMTSVNTELSLLGVASADIVLTGGGPGAEATPFYFNLENVVMA
ncbi:MAG: hypothetical protein QNK37_04865 [Acidobacteriota bacterium]|nr:hypothetical protein [Acidobacteriota bacterium]